MLALHSIMHLSLHRFKSHYVEKYDLDENIHYDAEYSTRLIGDVPGMSMGVDMWSAKMLLI